MRVIPPKQQELLQLIQDGWEIGIDLGMNPSAWIQKGGLGRGGEAKDVHYNTFHSMRANGLIKETNQSPFANLQHYHITQKGIDALKDSHNK